MELVTRIRHSAQSLQSSLLWLCRTPRSSDNISRPFLIADQDRRTNWSGQRLKVVRRDRYRCRGCDRKGDEVTLDIHLIRPQASDINAMLALCPNCRGLANRLKLSCDHIPDFLRQLWCNFHSAPKLIPLQVSVASMADDASLQQRKRDSLAERQYQPLWQRMSN